MPKTVLLIEPDDKKRRRCAGELRRAGYRVVPATSGRHRVVANQELRPDVTVVNCDDPGLRCLDDLYPLQTRNPGMKVVIHTARPEFKLNFKTWLADVFVVQSDDPTPLRRAIESLTAADDGSRTRRRPAGSGKRERG